MVAATGTASRILTTIAAVLPPIHWTNGIAATSNTSVTPMCVLTSHGRPLRPMYKLVTSRFHVVATSASTASTVMTIARGRPMRSRRSRARSITIGHVFDRLSANGTTAMTSTHVMSGAHDAHA